MFPILIDSGFLFIPAWHFMFAVGACVSFISLLRYSQKYCPDIPENKISIFFILSYFGGYFGARLYSIFIEQRGNFETLHEFFELLVSFGPMTLYGGMFGTFFVGSLYLRWAGIKPWNGLLDIATLSAFWGLGFGRIGCFLNGDDYGKPVPTGWESSFFAVTFPNLNDGIARYPVQLMEAAGVWGICILMHFFLKSCPKKYNYVAFGTVGLYSVLRFSLEFLRGDPGRGGVYGFSSAQVISIFLILMVLIVYLKSLQESQTEK